MCTVIYDVACGHTRTKDSTLTLSMYKVWVQKATRSFRLICRSAVHEVTRHVVRRLLCLLRRHYVGCERWASVVVPVWGQWRVV